MQELIQLVERRQTISRPFLDKGDEIGGGGVVGGHTCDTKTTSKVSEAILRERGLKAIKELNGEGASGPNSLLVFFYRKFWEITKMHVMATNCKGLG